MAKGIITNNPRPTRSKLRVIVTDENEETYGAVFDTELDFTNQSGEELHQFDTVEFTITSETTCDVLRKFVGPEAVVVKPDGNEAVLQTLPDPNPLHLTLSHSGFNLVYVTDNPGPAKMNSTIEIVIIDIHDAAFVKVIQSS